MQENFKAQAQQFSIDYTQAFFENDVKRMASLIPYHAEVFILDKRNPDQANDPITKRQTLLTFLDYNNATEIFAAKELLSELSTSRNDILTAMEIMQDMGSCITKKNTIKPQEADICFGNYYLTKNNVRCEYKFARTDYPTRVQTSQLIASDLILTFKDEGQLTLQKVEHMFFTMGQEEKLKIA